MTYAPSLTVTEVISDFLVSGPSLEEIATFRLPEALEHRALDLLARQKSSVLTAEEADEINDLLRMGHFLNVLRLKAQLRLAEEQ
jgi:hypothetical protein